MTQQSNTEAANKFDYDPKYEGIQEGIEVFGDMTFKQIHFIAKKLRDVPVIRGCYNVCSHCLLSAKPPIPEKDGYIHRMAHEDFKALCDGFIELNKRLGFNIFDSANNKHYTYRTLFYDSDGSNVYTKDENGNEHDFIELADMLYKVTNKRITFDTAGWNPKDKIAQVKMEKYAQYYSEDKNFQNIYLFDFSVNPFHSIYTASVKARKEGNLQRAEEYRNFYIYRQVNALFTITPVITKNHFRYVARAMKDGTKNAEGFTTKDGFLLYIDIIKKLEEKYNEDLNSYQPKHIHSKEQIKEILDILYSKLRNFSSIPYAGGRLADLYEKDDPILEIQAKRKKEILNQLQNMLNPDSHLYGVLDINGKFYIGTYVSTIKTELAFNFKNKDKQTAPFGPNMYDFVLTNDLLENII
jgi:hypothetical protein